MSGRNHRFLLRTSQVFVLGLCSAGVAAQIASAQTSAQTPATADARQPSGTAKAVMLPQRTI